MNSVLHCVELHCALLCSVVLHCTVTVLHCSKCTVPYRTVLCCGILWLMRQTFGWSSVLVPSEGVMVV